MNKLIYGTQELPYLYCHTNKWIQLVLNTLFFICKHKTTHCFCMGEKKINSHFYEVHSRKGAVDSSWNVMAHGDTWEGKWRGNWQMDWVASTLHTTSEHGVSNITTADAHISTASSQLNWCPRQFKQARHFAKRRNLVSACVPSHFNRPLQHFSIPWEIWFGY